MPFQNTVEEPLTKPAPVTARVNWPPPASADVGLSEVIVPAIPPIEPANGKEPVSMGVLLSVTWSVYRYEPPL